MNKKFAIASLALVLIGSFSCTNLDEQVYSEIPIDKFFKNEEEILMNAGRAYTKLQSYPEEFS